MLFIEENLPTYYESKDKKNPLKENCTPRFVSHESALLSPKSLGHSASYSKLGQSFNQNSSKNTPVAMQEEPIELVVENDEEFLFFME